MGLREKILSAEDRPFEDVEVPEWDSTVRVFGLSAGAAERFAAVAGSDGGKEGVRAHMVACTVADPATGELLFTEEDVPALQQKFIRVLDGLFDVASRLSGLTGLDDAEKN